MGLKESGSFCGLPGFRTGMTFASFHFWGVVPVDHMLFISCNRLFCMLGGILFKIM